MNIAKIQSPSQPTVDFSVLTEIILDDLFKDFKDSRWWIRTLMEPIARPATTRFAQVMANMDHIVAYRGFHEAMHYAASVFANAINILGYEHVPQKGPLLVISNHPGTCDGFVIASSLPRDDLKIVASGFPLFRNMPNTNQHLILVDPWSGEAGSNISVVRSAIRHLQSGGSVLIFPSGKIEPDPSVLPGAIESLSSWSPSIELFLRTVPDVKIQFTAVSGVISPIFLHNPLVKPLSGIRNPQAVAEVFQVVAQMMFEKWVRIRPVVTFGIPKTMDELRQGNISLYQSIIAEAGQLLTSHMQGNL